MALPDCDKCFLLIFFLLFLCCHTNSTTSHMNLEALHERAVQRELVEVLLQPTSDTSCVLIHGMGGTGKTVTAVAAVQERAIRTHFAAIFWLSVGADAVGERIKQLQTMLYKMLTGKNVQNEGQDEQEVGTIAQALAEHAVRLSAH